jgi:hypothetical protein
MMSFDRLSSLVEVFLLKVWSLVNWLYDEVKS